MSSHTRSPSLAATAPTHIQEQNTPSDRPRFLSASDAESILAQLVRASSGGGFTAVSITSAWTGNIRWGRNRVTTSGETLNHAVTVLRAVRGAWGTVTVNNVAPETLSAAAKHAERLAMTRQESIVVDAAVGRPFDAVATPTLFDQSTYDLDAERRALAARDLMQSAKDAGMLSAGYLAVSGKSMVALDTLGRHQFTQWTEAEYSVTVRAPNGGASGWAGVDNTAWGKIDGATLSKIALDKCVRSQASVRLEPGRYTTILEPQAVADLMTFGIAPYDVKPGTKLIDPRLTAEVDPSAPNMEFPAWSANFVGAELVLSPNRPTTYIKDGVSQEWWSGGSPLRMSGGSTTIEEMIASTPRGILVTRFNILQQLDPRSMLCSGVTRDGTWLIERGKISHPIKNFMFTESPLFVLNNVEQLGVPQRVFHSTFYPEWAGPPYIVPRIVPALKVRDFSFTSITDAV